MADETDNTVAFRNLRVYRHLAGDTGRPNHARPARLVRQSDCVFGAGDPIAAREPAHAIPKPQIWSTTALRRRYGRCRPILAACWGIAIPDHFKSIRVPCPPTSGRSPSSKSLGGVGHRFTLRRFLDHDIPDGEIGRAQSIQQRSYPHLLPRPGSLLDYPDHGVCPTSACHQAQTRYRGRLFREIQD